MLCRESYFCGIAMVWCLVGCGALVLANPGLTMAQTVYEREQGGARQSSAPPEVAQQARGSSGGSSVRVVPTFSISERYDSNILMSPGNQKSDFVTDIRPGARVSFSNDLVDGTLRASAISGIYVRNPELNYIGTQTGFDVMLDKFAERIVRGLGLRTNGMVGYFPEQSAFVTPDSGESDFLRGIQARRNNALNATSMVQGTYAVSPLVQLNSSYSFQTMRFFGQSTSSEPSTLISLFDTTVHGITAGPSYHLSPGQTIGASYSYRQVTFGPSTSGPGSGSSVGGGTSTIQGGVLTWKSALTSELTAELSPGASVSTATPDNLIWTVRASLTWVGLQKSATIAYSRGLYPSFAAQASLMVSDVINGSVSYNFTPKWSVTLGANYAVNSRSGETSLRFESIGANGTLRYNLSQGVFATISGSHNDFAIEREGSTTKYQRQTGMIALTAEWN